MTKKLIGFTNEEKKLINKISVICDTEEKLIEFLKFLEKKVEYVLKQKAKQEKKLGGESEKV